MRTLGVLVFALTSASGCSRSRAEIAAPVEVTVTSGSARAPSSSANVAPSSSANVAPSSSAPLAASHAPSCDIVIEALLDANVYRGTPSSQMKWDSYRQDPKYARFAQGIDHGARYLSCTWRVSVNGVRYQYERASHGGPASGKLGAEVCSDHAEAEDTARDIATFTDGCKDLQRGEYYGDFLKPDDLAGAAGSAGTNH